LEQLLTEALRDHRGAERGARRPGRREQVGGLARVALNQDDIGGGGNGVRPLDVQRDLGDRDRHWGRKWAGVAVLVVLLEAGRVGQPKLLVKDVQGAGIEIGVRRAHEVGIVAEVDHGDGLARSVTLDAAERDEIAALSPLDLLRGVAAAGAFARVGAATLGLWRQHQVLRLGFQRLG